MGQLPFWTQAALALALTQAAFAQPAEPERPPPAAAVVEQKLLMLDKVLNQSPVALRIAASGNEQARRHFGNARELLLHARTLVTMEQLRAADALAGEALYELGRAQQLVPATTQRADAELERYAQQLREESKHLAGQTLVYGRKFADRSEEFTFELARFRSYERLVPLALRELKPPKDATDRVALYLGEARSLRATAEAVAGRDALLAIRKINEGTDALRRALQAAGLDVPSPTGSE